ncbi:hypothetical protein KI387_013863, partial [Taxus chinensis]
MWRREIGWFLSVTYHIVEFVPSTAGPTRWKQYGDHGDKTALRSSYEYPGTPQIGCYVPLGGISRNAKKILQIQRESVSQILKAAMAINAQASSKMEIPDVYLEALPK